MELVIKLSPVAMDLSVMKINFVTAIKDVRKGKTCVTTLSVAQTTSASIEDVSKRVSVMELTVSWMNIVIRDSALKFMILVSM